MPLSDDEVRGRVARVENLLAEVEGLADPATQAKAVETIQALLDLYGEGLARVMAHASRAGEDAFVRALAQDELVSALLLVYDLHPDHDHHDVRPEPPPRAQAPAFIPLSALGVGGAGDVGAGHGRGG